MDNALNIKTMDNTRQILRKIRECKQLVEQRNAKPQVEDMVKEKEMNFLQEAEYLMSRHEKKNLNESESSGNEGDKEFVINKKTPQFGDVFTSQEEALKKTIGESINLGDKALVFYPNKKDLVLSGKIDSMNIAFQFRYADPSGDGIYIWANGLQLTESNTRTVGKIRDAFTNWKSALIQNGDLLDKMYKVASKQ